MRRHVGVTGQEVKKTRCVGVRVEAALRRQSWSSIRWQRGETACWCHRLGGGEDRLVVGYGESESLVMG